MTKRANLATNTWRTFRVHCRGRYVGYFAIALVAATMVPGSALAQTPILPPGAGTSADPYLISQIEHLVWVEANSGSSSGKFYTVQNDIDATATVTWNSWTGFSPIGTDTAPFAGFFNGNGKVISNLAIMRPARDKVGLFGVIGGGGLVKDISLIGVSVTGSNFVGGLAGHNSGGIISGCSTIGMVSGVVAIGGLVGVDWGTYCQGFYWPAWLLVLRQWQLIWQCVRGE